MKKFLLIFVVFSTLCFSQSITWIDETANYPTLPAGVKLMTGSRANPALKVYYLDIDLNNPKIAIIPYTTTSIATVPVLTQRFGAFAAVNGGFFSGSSSLSTVVQPGTLKAQNVASLTRNSKAYPVIRSFFSVKNDFSMNVDWIYHFSGTMDGIYKFDAPLPYIYNDPTPRPAPVQSQGTKMQNILVGIGGSPVLVKNGIKNITYNEEIMWGSGVGTEPDPRTAIGYTANKHCIMLVADGRMAGVSEGLSLSEMADIFLSLGCVEALNLDGGGSSQMAIGNKAINLSASRQLPVIMAVVHRDSLKLPATPTFEKIIDTESPEVSKIGTGWFASGNAGFYGSSATQLIPVGDGSSSMVYKLKVPKEAKYKLYGWWTASNNRATDAPYIVKSTIKTDTFKVNQAIGNATWNLIGEVTLKGDSTEEVIISNKSSTGTYVAADAIRLVSFDTTFVVGVEDEVLAVEEFNLFQNYPNPFNPSTTIKFNLDKSEFTQLKIYDVLGNELETLISNHLEKGIHQVNFTSKNYSSGVYFYRLSTPTNSYMRKMILIK